MADKAKVRIRLTSEVDGEKQEHTFGGEWYRKGRSVYLRYDERDEADSEVRTTVRWREGELLVTRRGDVESEQTFVAGARRQGQYSSPHASFRLETDTSLLWMQCGDLMRTEAADEPLGLTLPMLIEWHYTLWIDSQQTGTFVIRLQADRETKQ
ncbi:DUF1934 domain-containing protein [Paenibacillus humicola]|uniref:DUF1934 domain-containing protein n=1 Tax=Paenibacillus humicola TaxID=3110540 RepID=UPI00237C32D7|nr:DUF1934 domain-containing protein [Paenibacillus humicola]